MRVITFQPRFHQAIRNGVKTSTIRLKARCKGGDELSLRAWTGKPYRSKQAELMRAECVRVTPITLMFDEAPLYVLMRNAKHSEIHNVLQPDELQALAAHEGFTSAEDMRQWFATTYPEGKITGEIITWKPLPRRSPRLAVYEQVFVLSAS